IRYAFFFFQAEDGIRDFHVTGVQTCALPISRVDAKWGTTKTVHCMRDDQLYEYIVESKMPRKLNGDQVMVLARAFSALARMEPRSEERRVGKECRDREWKKH